MRMLIVGSVVLLTGILAHAMSPGFDFYLRRSIMNQLDQSPRVQQEIKQLSENYDVSCSIDKTRIGDDTSVTLKFEDRQFVANYACKGQPVSLHFYGRFDLKDNSITEAQSIVIDDVGIRSTAK